MEITLTQISLFDDTLNDVENTDSNIDLNDLYQANSNDNTVTSIELFAGAGGLALGLEQAGFDTVLLNEKDKWACQTLRNNRPHWQVLEAPIEEVDFKSYRGKIDLVTGGFPCQAFSYAGSKGGFDDIRGTLFFEFARAVQEIRPKIMVGENVRGLLNHDKGRTLATIKQVIDDIGYQLIEPKVLHAKYYQVPQKRERLILVAIRKDLTDSIHFDWPEPEERAYTLADGLKKGRLYDSDVPKSEGQKYPEKKKVILDLVPAGGYWRDLPEEVAKAYMKKSYYLGGGKTGMARRLAWDAPSLTLTCSPAQNQTERCHPDETRPLTVREYARIQTFPDHWQFAGSASQQYKQIGNAVPVNLAKALGLSLFEALSNQTGSR
jgi:DNA (cytosine-5)-methyltransferase 1